MEMLLGFKADHELWVRTNLSGSLAHQAELERYGEIIDEWSYRTRFDQWRSWSYGMNHPVSPRLHTQTMEQMTELGIWLLSVIWPGTRRDLERAFQNFHAVLRDFLITFNEEADWVNREGRVVAALTNRLSGVSIPEHHRQREREHADLVFDLALELTRGSQLRMRTSPKVCGRAIPPSRGCPSLQSGRRR